MRRQYSPVIAAFKPWVVAARMCAGGSRTQTVEIGIVGQAVRCGTGWEERGVIDATW